MSEYPNVLGMCHNTFFLDHDHLENQEVITKSGKLSSEAGGRVQSHFNQFEVEMIVALTLYLLKQGYKGEGNDFNIISI